MPYDNRSFVWYELNTATDNRSKAIAFYGETIGWKTTEMDMGGDSPYVMFNAGEQSVGGFGAPPAGIPSHWLAYLRVEDVDASTAAVAEHGGKVLMDAFDIPVGRMAVVQDPQGATFALFKEADPASESKPSTPGTFHWNELWSPDIDAVAPFYEAALGFTRASMDMPDGRTYTLLNDGEAMRCGGMTSPDPSIPAMWLAWVHVDNVDEAVGRAQRSGGELYGDIFDVPGVGRLGIVKDTIGAVIGLITPAAAS